MIEKKIAAVLFSFAVAGAALAQSGLGTEQQRANGKKLYDKYCSQCHGVNGDGLGVAYPFLKPKARDFTKGKYKIRTTPSGSLPTHQDLVNIIRRGMPYSSMPPWPDLTDPQVDDIVYYVKSFADDFAAAESEPQPIPIGKPPAMDEASIAKGREVYEQLGCEQCHGSLGRGDGSSAPTLKDDWGQHVRAADLTQKWTFRGGATRQDIYRTFSTGVNGTPMPSYYDAISDEDRWHLANYIYSLSESEEAPYANLVVADSIDDEIEVSEAMSLDEVEAIFAGAEPAMFPVFGQIVQVGRSTHPMVTSVTVKAAFDTQNVAFMLQWHDLRADTTGSNDPALQVPRIDPAPAFAEAAAAASPAADEGEDDLWGDDAADSGGDDFWGEEDTSDAAPATATTSQYSDAVAVQFPMQLPAGIQKPYFIFGDATRAVDLWYVDLGEGKARQYTGRGTGNLVQAERTELAVWSDYDRGRWTVVFTRPLRASRGLAFTEETYVPVAFSVWDGFDEERGNKRALSQWFYVYTEPRTEVSATGPMAKGFLITLAVELLVVMWILWRFGRRKKKAIDEQPVPA